MTEKQTERIQISCPLCSNGMKLTRPKQGKYKPKCKKCGDRFGLLIVDGKPPQTGRLKVASSDPRTVTKLDAEQETSVPASALPSPAKKGAATKGAAKTGAANTTDAHQANAETEIYDAGLASSNTQPMPERLGGYRIVKRLGQGGMGTVYQAKQLSLDRFVALKVVLAKWAKSPTVIARLTREAYAAAQLSHHNVVQVYDLCRDRETNFFSMEFVDGPSLDVVVRNQGRLDPQKAASYILQAARGLQCAHAKGMVHRDVKPANLILSPDGIVKVADLGLVKVPFANDPADENDIASNASSQITLAGHAVGTAAYMSPEQTIDSANIDHRSDIYSLGCTFYVLLTGKAPFGGTTVKEVISKHQNEKVTPPEIHAAQIDSQYSDIVVKMMAKEPENRYANMGQLISRLEEILGIHTQSDFSPTEDQANLVSSCAKTYAANSLAKLRNLLLAGMTAAFTLLATGATLFNWRLATAMLASAILAPAASLAITGWRRNTYLFERFRSSILGATVFEWVCWGAWTLLFLTLLALTGTLGYWVFAAALAVGVGFAYEFLVEQPIGKQRQPAVEQIQSTLRSLRLSGVPENDVRMFVARYAGNNWEELFECLFGYRAKRDAREVLSRTAEGRKKKKFWGWRDGIADRLDHRLDESKKERQQKHIQKVEEANLKSHGIAPLEARAQAEQIATGMVRQAISERMNVLQDRLEAVDPVLAAENKRERIKAMLADARSGKYAQQKSPVVSFLQLVFGPQARFILGALLLTGCLLWINQNDLFSIEDIQRLKQTAQTAVSSAVEGQDVASTLESAKEEFESQVTESSVRSSTPLGLPIVGKYFDSLNPGVAGLFLLLSFFVAGIRITVFLLPAALIMVLGPTLGMPGIEMLGGSHTTSLIIGAAIAIVGFLFGRNSLS